MVLALGALSLFLFMRPDIGDAGAPIRIKLGTIAPEDSPWYNTVRTMGDRWAEASNGRVKMKIYAGGVSGDEGQIIRKMRINQLQAGTVSSTGLIDIDRGSLSLQAPRVITTYEALDYIWAKIEPMLTKRVEERGYKVLTWGDIGWVYFFSKTKISTPRELKALKLWGWEGDPPATKAFSRVGLRPVTIASTDVLPALQTGMIEGYPQTALASLALQWFGGAKYMLNLRWSPMVGATVVTNKAWAKIPSDLQPKLLEIAREEGRKLTEVVRKLDQDSVQQMISYGLTLVEPQEMPEWDAFAKECHEAMRGEVMPGETFDEVLRLKKEFLATQTK